ncbi:MAG: methylaspartate ammonia-lyase [Betaproteobacteria bacterium]|nr:methylaspartate ammonia-lyase [Betaproteobacteria bacterium]
MIKVSAIDIRCITFAEGIGGYWVNDQPAVQAGATRDGFFFKGDPVTPGFKAIREPSTAYCVTVELADGQLAYGDCVTVFNAGCAGRPRPLRAAHLPTVQEECGRLFDGKSFKGFRDAADALSGLSQESWTLPVAFGISQALLSAAALHKRVPMARVLMDEYGLTLPAAPPQFAGSCGGEWELNVDKAIARRLAMFPQSAIQTRSECEKLPDYVSWIVRRVGELAGLGYVPDLHFDFHASLGRMFGNDEDRVCDYLADIVKRAGPFKVYFEDPMLSASADEALDRMSRLRERFDSRGPHCGLIADEWANAPEEMLRFASGKAAHAIQIKVPDNGSLVTAIDAVRTCREHGILPYLGGSCNETDISARATVHVGIAFGAWRLFTKPGMGFDEGLMVMTNEMSRTFARL